MIAAPDWAKSLRGFDRVVFEEGDVRIPVDDGGYAVEIVLPKDLLAMTAEVDPLIPAYVLATTIRSLEARLGELVQIARGQGHSWARIGEALGVARQTAWEKYSDEE